MIFQCFHTGCMLDLLLRVQGIDVPFWFVYSEEKLLPFERIAEILGVVPDLSRSSEGRASILNEPSTVEKLNDALQGS